MDASPPKGEETATIPFAKKKPWPNLRPNVRGVVPRARYQWG